MIFELPIQVSFASESFEIPHFKEKDSSNFSILGKNSNF